MIEINKLKPFANFCYTIGMIPTSYKESLTYEEQLLWFCNFLENTVIPTVNNIGFAVAELQNLYVELRNYVNNYFENLDVQEEINNKLDEMAESGILEEIMAEYLNTKAVFGFDNVEAMKEAENLKNGSFARTFGYFSKNDGGSSFYKIREVTNLDIIDEMTIIAMNDENLVAEFINDKELYNVMQFGLKIDDTSTNITEKLNDILNLGKNLIFKDLTFTINDNLNLKSNTKIKFQNCNITNETSTNQKYILNISNCENVEIEGINTLFQFNKPSTAQQACISINNSKNINIKGLSLKKAGGDGIIINGTHNKDTENIIIDNCLIDNNRRNGISLVGGTFNILINNCKIINTSGANPQFGIDLEPWQDNVINDTIIIKNCYFNSNVGGIDILLQNKNITIKNNIFDGNGISSVMTVSQGEENYPKNCIIEDNNFINSTIYLRGTQYAEFNILNNKFNTGKITTDAEPDFVSISSGLPKNGFLNIKNNIINNSNGNAFTINGCSNANICDNRIYNCSKKIIEIIGSNNVNVKNNITIKYQTAEDSVSSNSAISIQTSSNISIENNELYNDETSELTLSNLISIAVNATNVKLINNKAPIGNYNNLIYNESNSIFFKDNESKRLFNDTTKYRPAISEKYIGMIYNRYDSTNDKYTPTIVINDNGTFKWKDL